MKLNGKIFLCVLLLLCSCAESLPIPQADPALATQEFFEKASEQHASEFLSAFEFNERCKPACWFGVEPGVTTIDDAVTLLAGNGKSGVRLSKIAGQEIRAEWYVGKDRFLTQVYILAEANVVKSITLQQMYIRVKYFIDLLGTPDGASANIYQAPNLTVTNYYVYYLEKKMALNIMDYDLQGLDQDAFTEAIFLGDEFNVDNIMQPWVGYGHLKEYLPGQAWPTGLPPTP